MLITENFSHFLPRFKYYLINKHPYDWDAFQHIFNASKYSSFKRVDNLSPLKVMSWDFKRWQVWSMRTTFGQLHTFQAFFLETEKSFRIDRGHFYFRTLQNPLGLRLHKLSRVDSTNVHSERALVHESHLEGMKTSFRWNSALSLVLRL